MNYLFLSIKRKRSGYTLIELLVVIAIIGILSAVVLTSLGTARAKARVAAVQETLHSLQTAGHTCMNDAATINYPTETIDGGATTLCLGSAAQYGQLPAGWIYCDDAAGTQSDTDCGNEVAAQTVTTFSVIAESNIDGQVVTCTESVCTTVADVD